MRIEFLVEELSARVVLENLVPRILGRDLEFSIRFFQGKHDLLKSLPGLLRGYRRHLGPDTRLVILLDLDRADCLTLKRSIEDMVRATGFVTKSMASADGKSHFEVLVRIAIEELESWFFGDMDAIRAAYPRARRFLGDKSRLRNPDAIPGGTSETLERILRRSGYHRGGLDKLLAARDIGPHMDPSRNRSRSFRAFCDGLQAIVRGTAGYSPHSPRRTCSL